jgi:hypothetical protein
LNRKILGGVKGGFIVAPAREDFTTVLKENTVMAAGVSSCTNQSFWDCKKKKENFKAPRAK